jgi:hypothetical protein
MTTSGQQMLMRTPLAAAPASGRTFLLLIGILPL